VTRRVDFGPQCPVPPIQPIALAADAASFLLKFRQLPLQLQRFHNLPVPSLYGISSLPLSQELALLKRLQSAAAPAGLRNFTMTRWRFLRSEAPFSRCLLLQVLEYETPFHEFVLQLPPRRPCQQELFFRKGAGIIKRWRFRRFVTVATRRASSVFRTKIVVVVA
jgi:hypothetical protein